MSISAIGVRRPTSGASGQTLLLGAAAVAAAVWVGLVGLESRHAFLHDAVPVLLVPVALWLFFSERYEVTLAVLLIYLGLLDGVVKLASGSSVATLGRDVLLYAIALGAVVRMILRKTPLTVPPLAGIVLAWVAVCVMQLANPSDISLVHAAAALRQHLEFAPLFFFGYFVLRSQRRLTGLLLLLLVAGAANGIVDLVQSQMTPTQLASWGPGYAGLELGTATRVARVFINAAHQASVRPPGLGGTDGFGGEVCLIALPCAIALLSSFRRSAKLGWLLLPATGLTIAGIVASQTRLALVGGAIALLVFLVLTITSRRGITALVLTLAIGFVGYLIVSGFVSGSANRYSSIAPSQLSQTIPNVIGRHETFTLVPKYIADYPLGAGLGSVGPAGGSTIGGLGKNVNLSGESELTFLLVETGLPGLVVMTALSLAAIRAGLKLSRAAEPDLKRSLMALTAVLISLLAAWLIGPVTADSPTAPFMWLSAGCLAYWYAQLRAGRVPVQPRRLRASLAMR